MHIIKMKTWHEFRSYIDKDSQALPVYWRGQACPSWPLASRFERIILNMLGGSTTDASKIYPYDGRYQRGGKAVWEDGFYQTMRDRYLTAFQEAASGLRGANPKELNDKQWWALGRHYGLITPFLDWTEKPYIAGFFALTDPWSKLDKRRGIRTKSKEVAIYRLINNEQLEGDGLRVVKPIVVELGRMHGQRGLVTWVDSEIFFELQGFLDNTDRADLPTCIILSDQAMLDGMRDLAAHGIDYRSLYPDMVGAAMHANIVYDALF